MSAIKIGAALRRKLVLILLVLLHAGVIGISPALALAPAPAPSPQQEAGGSGIQASGGNVTQATFGQQGRTLGKLQQTGPRTWQEQGNDGGTFTFDETGRDEWSVYLRDASRGVRLQIDLHRKLVLYEDGDSGDMTPLYDISAASSAPVGFSIEASQMAPTPSPVPAVEAPRAPPSTINADGRTVTQATFGQQGRTIGQYRQTGPGTWRESADSGAGFSFNELGRDDWSVYLHDPSRNVKIQLDLHRKLILYAAGGSTDMQPLYEILSAGSPAVPAGSPSVAGTGTQPIGPGPSGPELVTGGNDSRSQKDFCWKDSYGRGVGTVPGSCSSDRDRIGLLCYSKCPINSQRFGFDCHTVCPSGMRDDGLFCRAAEYGRGAGYPVHFGEFDGDGMKSRCERDHGKGQCELDGLIYYPKCKAGYAAVGCCICRPKVPNCSALGMNPGVDLSCAKKVVIGDPVTGSCPPGEQKDGGLCYRRCKAGYTGVGPVCWTAAPSSWVECGMGAAKDSRTCGEIVYGQVASVGQVAYNLATLGSGGAAVGAASSAAKAERLADLKRRFTQLKSLYKANEQAIQAALLAKRSAGATLNTVQLVDDDKVTEEDIVRISAEIAAIADPSGVASTVAAYTYPVCSKYGF